MYFKVSFLICSIYFFTAAWSLGLSEKALNTIVQLVEDHRAQNGDNNRITMVEYERIDNDNNKKFHNEEQDYNYKFDSVAMIDDKSLPDLLIYLSNLEKIIDGWEGKTFTTYEVNLFVNIFKKKDKKGFEGKDVGNSDPDGLLTHAELVSLIQDDLLLEPKHKEEIKNEFNDGDSINALMFLVTILKHKPNGKGLDILQLRKCSALYTSFYDNFPTEGLIDLFLALQIVSYNYVGLLLKLNHVQPPANELQELLVFLSEYNKEVDENSKHFTTLDVRDMIKEFSRFDINCDGVLSYIEFSPLARDYLLTEDILNNSGIPELKSVAKLYHLTQTEPTDNETHFNHDDKCSLNTATFLFLKYYLRFERNNNESDDNVTTNQSNVMVNNNLAMDEAYARRLNDEWAMEDINVPGNYETAMEKPNVRGDIYGRAKVETNVQRNNNGKAIEETNASGNYVMWTEEETEARLNYEKYMAGTVTPGNNRKARNPANVGRSYRRRMKKGSYERAPEGSLDEWLGF